MTTSNEHEDSSPASEPTFADVLNNLSPAPARSRRRSRQADAPADEPAEVEQPEQAPVEQVDEAATSDAAIDDEVPDAGDEQVAAAVRPYAWTGGRTRPVYELEVETLVSTSEYGRDVAALTSVEHRSVAQLCTSPRSVAEIAALLPVPLGVARVVVGDMADIGLVEVHQTASTSGAAPDTALMERVLSGLRRL